MTHDDRETDHKKQGDIPNALDKNVDHNEHAETKRDAPPPKDRGDSTDDRDEAVDIDSETGA